MKELSKMENLTLQQLRKAEAEFVANGSKPAQTFSNVEPGLLEGIPVLVKSGQTKTVNFFIIPYKRNGEQRHFTGAYFNGKHTNGKSYDNLAVGLTDEEQDKVNEPDNRSKSYDLRASQYRTADNQERVIVKMI